MALDQNIRVARRCIDYVNGLNVTSNNVPFRISSYAKYSHYHYFVVTVTRCETLGVPEVVLMRRRLVLQALAHLTRTEQQKRAEVEGYMNEWGVNYFRQYTPNGFFVSNITEREDEARIRMCRRVMKTRQGNCGEKSAVCATWLLENSPGNEVILWVGGKNYDHGWVVFGHNATHWNGVIDTLSDDAVVVDGWTGDYYQAKRPFKLWQGLANPFQLTVRYNILNASGNIKALEHVRRRDWTESFSSHFRLAYADQAPSTYEPWGAHMLRWLEPDKLIRARDVKGRDEAAMIARILKKYEKEEKLVFADD
jgi:hypothetical protein